MPRKVYVACPYSGTEEQREARVAAANEVAASLMRAGDIVFSPITHGHAIACQCTLPHGWDFWEAQDRAFLEWCDVVVVVKVDGWLVSNGVQKEISLARSMGKDVEFIEV